MKQTYRKSWARNLVMLSHLAVDPSFKIKQGQPNLKVLITHLLLVPEVCNVKPTYRKSWAGNLLMWSHITLSPSFKVKQGQPNLKVLVTYLLLILEVCNVKPTCRISWAGNLLMLLDLTFAPPPSRSNDGSLGLVSYFSGGYKFASFLRCVGLFCTHHNLSSDIFYATVLRQNIC